MNGLTSANVDHLTEAINRSIDRYKADGKKEMAGVLEDLVYAVDEMRRYNTTQPSRPDRIGDQCWYCVSDLWRRGVLRAWLGETYEGHAVAVEDFETKAIRYVDHISFSTEAPA